MAYRFVEPWTDVGDGITPADGALLYFYDQGTSNAKTTYSDFALTVPNSDPIIADANGVFGDIFLDTAADVTLRDKNNVLIVGPRTVYPPGDSVNNLAASSVAVTDGAGYYAATNAETVLAEIGGNYLRSDREETVTANMTFSGAQLISPELSDFSVKHNSVASSAGTLIIDLSTGNSFSTTLTENVTTLTISNVPATGFAQFTLEVTQDGAGGAYTLAQPASVITPGGSPPVISTGNDAVDDLAYRTVDGGTTWKLDFSQAYA